MDLDQWECSTLWYFQLLTSNLPTIPWSMLGATTIPFLGASGSSLHLAGTHLGRRFQVPLWQTTLPLWLGWNWGTQRTSTDWLWPAQDDLSHLQRGLSLHSNLPTLEPLALSLTNPLEMWGTTQGAGTDNYIRSGGAAVKQWKYFQYNDITVLFIGFIRANRT